LACKCGSLQPGKKDQAVSLSHREQPDTAAATITEERLIQHVIDAIIPLADEEKWVGLDK